MDIAENGNLLTPNILKRYSYHDRRITQLLFFRDGRGLLSSSLDGNCIYTNCNGNGKAIGFKPHDGPVLDVSYTPKDNLAATCSTDNTARIWRPDEKPYQIHKFVHSDIVRGLDIDVNSSKLATISDDNSIKIWDLETRNYCNMMTVCQEAWLRSIKFSPDGLLVATAGQDRRVRIYDCRNKFPIKVFKDFSGVARKLNWFPDNTLLGAAFNDNRIQIYNIPESQVHQIYDVHAAPVNDVVFHPDGRFIASASEDHSVKIIDISLGLPLYTMLAHKSPVRSIEFNRNGRQLVSGDDAGQIYLWKTNFNTYNPDRFVENSSQRETMAAAGEIHSDTSIVVNQLKVKVPHIDRSNVIFNENINNKIYNVHQQFRLPSRIPMPIIQRGIRYELDDY